MIAGKPSALVPQRRFPEYGEDPGWDHAKVADLVETVTPPKKLTTSTYLPAGRFPIIDQSQSYICGWTNDDEAVISKPLPVIVFGDHTCVLKFVNRPFAQGADGIKILTAKRHVSTVYLYHQLTYRPVVMEEYKRHFSALKDKVIRFPDLKSGEQQKIADCLGSLDDLIAAEGLKLEVLRQHKQGLMQQLFPQPGENVPRLRFPEFEDAGDWEEKRLSTLVKLVSGVHLAPGMYSTTGEVPYFTGPSDFTDAIQGVAKWTDESANTAKQHDTLITVKGSGVGEIWYLTLPSVTMGRQLMAVRTEVGDRRFIYQFLSTKRAQFEALASGNLIPGLSRGDILEMVAFFPSQNEQQRIADCLTSIDDQLDAQACKLDTLRQHKRALQQQLFPTLEGQ